MIEIPLPNGYRLFAAQSEDPTYPNEIYLGVLDHNGRWVQDLAIVMNAYQYNDDGDVVWKKDEFEVLVYADKDNEDFTNDFTIGLYNADCDE